MSQYWLVVGRPKNWEFAFENGNIWGVKEFRELKALWNLLEEGDELLFYAANPVGGIIGFGRVTTKFRQTKPLWPDEVKSGSVKWPLKFEFEVEYCLRPSLWKTRCYQENNLQLITRMVFQCLPIRVVDEARKHFELPPVTTKPNLGIVERVFASDEVSNFDHETIKRYIADIGKIQGFVAELEYPINGNRLDVVWRRVEKSVLTFVFEVQLGGDIYHALGKLKHAYDLWNSRIFLAADLSERPKVEELLAGTFHEIKDRIKFITLSETIELYNKKLSYKNFEKELGILA